MTFHVSFHLNTVQPPHWPPAAGRPDSAALGSIRALSCPSASPQQDSLEALAFTAAGGRMPSPPGAQMGLHPGPQTYYKQRGDSSGEEGEVGTPHRRDGAPLPVIRESTCRFHNEK